MERRNPKFNPEAKIIRLLGPGVIELTNARSAKAAMESKFMFCFVLVMSGVDLWWRRKSFSNKNGCHHAQCKSEGHLIDGFTQY